MEINSVFQLHEVTLMQFQDGKKIRIFDCRGVEVRETKSTKCYEADLKNAINGKIKKGYEVNVISLHYLLRTSQCCINASFCFRFF